MYKGVFLSVLGLRFLCLAYCGQFHELRTEATLFMKALASVRWHKGDTPKRSSTRRPAVRILVFQTTGRASGVITAAALAPMPEREREAEPTYE
jgi:hypothetical protein